MSNQRPNILVIMSDQHNKGVLGCAGDPLVRTPNIDSLASQGMRFENAYTPSPICVPARMSFMTGRTPSHNQVWDNDHILSSGIPTWAHALTAAEYETALIGRMHFVGSDQRHGFEFRPVGEYMARCPGGVSPPYPTWDKKRVIPSVASSQWRDSVTAAGKGKNVNQWADDKVTDGCIEYLKEKGGEQGGKPFAAVAGFMLPHNPYVAPPELFDYYYSRIDIPETEPGRPASIERMLKSRGFDPPLDKERIRVARAAYYALTEYLDTNIGRILNCLKETGLDKNTLVVYCSDHGDMVGEHGCWCKSCFYEGSAGVPLIARLPGVVEEGAVSDAVCSLLDLAPTFTDIAETDTMAFADGRSLLPILKGNKPGDWKDETYSELVDLASWPRRPVEEREPYMPSRMIRSGKWKLWVHEDSDNLKPTLFNLEDDPLEKNDLGGTPENAEIEAELLAKVKAGWEPERACRLTKEASISHRIISEWGEKTKPESPDAMVPPPTEYDQDVELL